MIKKILILSFITIILSACGYSSLYKDINDKKLNLKIIQIKGDKELNNFILSKLKKYINKDGEQIKLKIFTNYTKTVVSRDTKGSISNYQLEANAVFNIEIKGKNKSISMKEDFIMKNISDSYEKKNYEKTIKQNLSNSIANELILRLSTIR
jgi:outer membrane lipopolysaccharide assembly protein LptE/RlpB